MLFSLQVISSSQSLVKPTEHGTLNDAAVAELGIPAENLSSAGALAEVLQQVMALCTIISTQPEPQIPFSLTIFTDQLTDTLDDPATGTVFAVVAEGKYIDGMLLPEATRKGLALPSALTTYIPLLREIAIANPEASVKTLAEAANIYSVQAGSRTLGLLGCDLMQQLLCRLLDSGGSSRNRNIEEWGRA